MNCHDALLVQAYLDDELDAAQSLEVARHVETCERCGTYYRRLEATRGAMSHPQLRYQAPAYLRASILPAAPRANATSRHRLPAWGLALAASFVALAAIGGFGLLRGTGTRQDAVVAEAISGHMRSMQLNHLIDVVSTDQHTVKPWFDGKLDFSPEVTDLVAEGFPLAGGRMDVLQGRSVAALVYRHRLHVVNLYQWPASGSTEPAATAADGYNAVSWTEGGMAYIAVSNVAPDTLDAFVAAFRGRNSLRNESKR
jgi:anti-sigma factor RsiW